MGTLYVVGTPIGNLEDTSARALRVLREVALIAAEDTRHTRKLLNHFEITTSAISYHAHSGPGRAGEVVARLEQSDVALVTDAGTPGISDPGYELIRAAIEAGHTVVGVPGPNAAILALAVSGLPTDRFLYLGFLPRRSAERLTALREVAALPYTLVFYEAPHRLPATLRSIGEALGSRRMAAARELTKLHEEVLRGTVDEVLAHFTETLPRGEFTLVVAGAKEGTAPVNAAPAPDALALAQRHLEAGQSARDAAQAAAREAGVPWRQVYKRLLEKRS